jgi:hypothetical protein
MLMQDNFFGVCDFHLNLLCQSEQGFIHYMTEEKKILEN